MAHWHFSMADSSNSPIMKICQILTLTFIPISILFFESCNGNAAITIAQNTVTNPIGAAPDMNPPTLPGNLMASGIGSTQININWSAATDDRTLPAGLQYEICVTSVMNACNTFSVGYTTTQGAVTYSLTGLNSLTTYYVQVRARDAAGNTGVAANVSATTLAAGNTNPPFFTPGAALYNAAQNVTLQSSSSGAFICYTTDGTTDPVCDQAATTCTTGTKYAMPLAVANSTTLRTRACKTGYTDSAVTQAAYVIDTTPPAVMTSLNATAGERQILLTWSAASDNMSTAGQLVYEICLTTSVNGCSAFNISYQTGAGALAYTISNLTNGVPYYVSIRARDGAGNRGPAAGPATATPIDNGAPTFGGVTAAATLSPPGLRIYWPAATDATTPQSGIVYDICVSQNGGNFFTPGECQSAFSTTYTTGAGVTSYDLTGLTRFTNYYIVVRARDAAGNRDFNTVQKLGQTTVTDEWIVMTPSPGPQPYGYTAAQIGSKVYFYGGNSLKEYDLATNTLTTKANGLVSVWRHSLCAAAGKLYLFGGLEYGQTNAISEYDPATDVWTRKGYSWEYYGYQATCATVNDKVYFIGGFQDISKWQNFLIEYNPATSSYIVKMPMPTKRSAIASAVYNNKIYVFGGYSGNTVAISTVEMYDPAGNSWSTIASMPAARDSISAATLNNRIYVFGGAYQGDPTATVQEFDPINNSWSLKNNMPEAQKYQVTITYNDEIRFFRGDLISSGTPLADYRYR